MINLNYSKTDLTGMIFLVLLMLLSCNGEKEVTITKDYVINPNWDETANVFRVVRMKVKDSIDLTDVSPPELLERLETDTSFAYTANVKFNGEKYSERKVYFDRENGFLWWGNIHYSNTTKKILGELQQETWYLLGGLSNTRTLYYAYIDSLGNLHSFRVPASSWTNY